MKIIANPATKRAADNVDRLKQLAAQQIRKNGEVSKLTKTSLANAEIRLTRITAQFS